ncbi:MAG: hypothetical protein ACRDQZ_15040, partial [Mycobacteriales bacterium]
MCAGESSVPTTTGLIERLAASPLLRGSLVVLTIQALSTLVRYATQVLFAHAGGPAAYGDYAFAFSWAQLLIGPAALGFTFSVLRFVPAYLHSGETSKLLGFARRSVQFALAGACSVAGLGAAITWALGPSGPKLDALLVGFLMLPVLVLVSLHKELIRGAQ